LGVEVNLHDTSAEEIGSGETVHRPLAGFADLVEVHSEVMRRQLDAVGGGGDWVEPVASQGGFDSANVHGAAELEFEASAVAASRTLTPAPLSSRRLRGVAHWETVALTQSSSSRYSKGISKGGAVAALRLEERKGQNRDGVRLAHGRGYARAVPAALYGSFWGQGVVKLMERVLFRGQTGRNGTQGAHGERLTELPTAPEGKVADIPGRRSIGWGGVEEGKTHRPRLVALRQDSFS